MSTPSRNDKWQNAAAWFSVATLAFSAIVTVIASLLTPHTNMIASTISDVAAGPYDWVQDMGFYVQAAGLCALAYAMRLRGDRQWYWLLAMAMPVIMAVALVVMGYYEEYGDGDEGGFVVHYYMVYAYGLSFLALLMLTIPVLKREHSWWLPLNIGVAVVFALVSWYFFSMGTQWDGLVERFLGALQLAWLFLFSWRMARDAEALNLPSGYVPDIID